MRNLRSLVLVGAITAALGACGTLAPTTASAPLDSYHFDYTIDDREAVTLIQAFDDGAHTYLQFRDLPRELPIIESPDTPGDPVAWSRNGNYAVVSGVHHVLTITVGGRAATVTNRHSGTVATASPASAKASPVVITTPSTDRDCKATGGDLAVLRAKIAATEAELADARAQLAALQAALAEHRTGPRGPVMLRFDEHGAELVTPELLDELVPVAEHASRVILKGRVAASQPSDTGRDLALKRALLVRRLLISKGVPANKIRLFYSSGGFLIAPLDSAEGRAKNSRVEVHFSSAAVAGATI